MLPKLDPLHDCLMEESARFVPRTSLTTAAAVVLTHTAVTLVHGAAHMQLHIELSPWANIYVLAIVGVGPIAGLLLLASTWQRTGATILFTTMIGALLFGIWKHFIAYSADHVLHVQAGAWRLPFQATAVLLALSESAGAIVASMLLYALTRDSKAPIRSRNS